uniref:Uncharacterized protein n=1 Tax=Strix occidentalis caurina TaxID=311401 RepID=A0A8D0F264_STROC
MYLKIPSSQLAQGFCLSDNHQAHPVQAQQETCSFWASCWHCGGKRMRPHGIVLVQPSLCCSLCFQLCLSGLHSTEQEQAPAAEQLLSPPHAMAILNK